MKILLQTIAILLSLVFWTSCSTQGFACYEGVDFKSTISRNAKALENDMFHGASVKLVKVNPDKSIVLEIVPKGQIVTLSPAKPRTIYPPDITLISCDPDTQEALLRFRH
jgi:hypothetical protein